MCYAAYFPPFHRTHSIFHSAYTMSFQISQYTLQYIQDHRTEEVHRLALAGTRHLEVDLPFALEQIAGWQQACRKLPTWAATPGIVFPSRLSMEQCSSEHTARYKAQLIDRIAHGGTFTDLTGGFGVDFAYIAGQCRMQRAVYVERQQDLCLRARHNMHCLQVEAEVVCAEAAEYLKDMPPCDVIMIDPARRDMHGQRTMAIEDCSPNVLTMLDEMDKKARFALIKLSPMLDWRKAVEQMDGRVREVHIVGDKGECKELLLLLGKGTDALRLFCAHEGTVIQAHFDARWQWLEGQPEGYLYEPNPTIMKADCHPTLCALYGVKAVARNSHLFVSDTPIKDFPGRRFRILECMDYNKRNIRSLCAFRQANITVRNFPLSAVELRKKLHLIDGGDSYLFATTLADGRKVILHCRPMV